MKWSARAGREKGHTLVEFSLVVATVGVAAAAAIPAYGLLSGTKTYAAEADLTAAAQVENVSFITDGRYQTAAEAMRPNHGIAWTSEMPGASEGGGITLDGDPATAPVNTILLGEKGQDGLYYWVALVDGTAAFATKVSDAEPAYHAIVGRSWASATRLP